LTASASRNIIECVGNRYLDWFRQAEADLAAARDSLAAGHFEWACFTAQQAAEKAVKALFLHRGMDAWGHTITPLLGNLPAEDRPEEDIVTCAKVLDKHYIPTRYPNGLDSGAPADFYTRPEAEAACDCARKIIDFCSHSARRS
jgi:HEPN domain-containing protein